MKKLSILFILFLTLSTLQSQISQSEYKNLASAIPNEKTELLVNSSVLLSGEYLYYQAYTLNLSSNVYSDISKVIYIEFINANEEPIFQQKLNVLNNAAGGEFFIPAALETGHYKLIAYTNWSKNNTIENFDQVDIFVINPFTKKTQFNSKTIDSSKVLTIKNNSAQKGNKKDVENSNLRLTLHKSSYQTRELVKLNISNTNLEQTIGDYVLSVRKTDQISVSDTPLIRNTTTQKPLSNYLPELRGELISGTVIDNISKKPLADKVVSLSFPDKTFIFKLAQTNKDGQFYFNVDKKYENEKAIIQITDSTIKDYTISLHPKSLESYGNLDFRPIQLEANIKEWLETRSIENQIDNSYFETKSDSLIHTKDDDVFFNSLGKTYKLDDYTRFPTLRQTFIEVISTAYISSKNDSVYFHVPDLTNLEYNRNFNHFNPLVLMDGIVIIDNNDIINYSPNRLESITVIPGIYIYGPQIYNGIISIISSDQEFSLPNTKGKSTFEMVTPASNKKYYQPDYTDPKLVNIPDYRSQLLWEPNFKIDKISTEIEFYTSDSKGTYQATLEGYSKNGVYWSKTVYFEVK